VRRLPKRRISGPSRIGGVIHSKPLRSLVDKLTRCLPVPTSGSQQSGPSEDLREHHVVNIDRARYRPFRPSDIWKLRFWDVIW
jgi:hypothetical protein